MTDFRAIIRDAMQQRGVTQAQLSRDSGVSQGAISTYLNLKRDMYSENVALMLDALGVELEATPPERVFP